MLVEIRELKASEFDIFKSIRLELLDNNPSYFGSDYDSESKFPDQTWKDRLTKDTVKTYGIFSNTDLCGICVLVFSPRNKMKHVATLNSMYIRPEFQRKGLAKKLIEKILEDLSSMEIKRLNLSVVSENNKAISMYENLGFVTYGLEPETIKFNNKYFDLILMTKDIGGKT